MRTSFLALHPPSLYPSAFKVPAPEGELPRQVEARQTAPVLRWQVSPGAEALGSRELVWASWAWVPPTAKSLAEARLKAAKTQWARAEGVAESLAFRAAWAAGQRCIVPMNALEVDDWRSRRAVPTRITRVDNQPLGVAGLWSQWTGAEGESLLGFCVITVDAQQHALMQRYGAPGADKRLPVILNEGAYDAWLKAPLDKATQFLRAYPAQALRANPVQKGPPPL